MDNTELLNALSSMKKKKKIKKKDLEKESALIDKTVSYDVELYTYDELLDKAYNQLKKDKPNWSNKRKRLVLKPPDVSREGTRKTAINNFIILVEQLNRDHEHVMHYFMSELMTEASIDLKQRLLLKGRFQPASIEKVLRKYAIEYVLCSMCKSCDTILEREQSTRLMYMICNDCGAKKSIKSIKKN